MSLKEHFPVPANPLLEGDPAFTPDHDNEILREDERILNGEAVTDPIPAQQEPERRFMAPSSFDIEGTKVTANPVEQHARVDIPVPVRRDLGHVASHELSPAQLKDAELDDFFSNRQKPTEVITTTPSSTSFNIDGRPVGQTPNRSGVRDANFDSPALRQIAELHNRSRNR